MRSAAVGLPARTGAIVVSGSTLILAGAITRAAAFSAIRAGLRPWCVDLFADAYREILAALRRDAAV